MVQNLGVPDHIYTITPSDTDLLPNPIRGIRVVTGGTVKVLDAWGQEATLNFSDGETRLVSASKVFATGTTAVTLEGLV
jgi:hypothetical protein